jgi:hypothetical protein
MQLNGKNSILQRLIFEVRYEYGYAYLDKCGRIINTIMREFPEWCVRTANVEGTSLFNVRNDSLFAFSSRKFDFTLEQDMGGPPLSMENLADFAEQSEVISAILIEQFGLKDFTRMGFRSFHGFACSSSNEANSWINGLGFYSVSHKLEEAVGGEAEASSFTVIIPGEKWKYRIEVVAVEQQLRFGIDQEVLKVPSHVLYKDQKQHLLRQMAIRKKLQANPEFSAVIDSDLFQEFPMVINPRDFIIFGYDDLTRKLKLAAKR